MPDSVGGEICDGPDPACLIPIVAIGSDSDCDATCRTDGEPVTVVPFYEVNVSSFAGAGSST